MSTYLYVLWSVQDNIVKVGITKSPQRRFASHAGNSSNPVDYILHRHFRFEEVENARCVEKRALANLSKQGFGIRGKRELFRCSPDAAVRAVDTACKELCLPMERNFPVGVDALLHAFQDFPSLPEQAFEQLSPDQIKLYIRGVRDVLWCLCRFDGLSIRTTDMLQLWANAEGVPQFEVSDMIAGYYRNISNQGHGNESPSIAEEAYSRLKADRRDAFVAWQEA